MNPPIITLSLASTKQRILMLLSHDVIIGDVVVAAVNRTIAPVAYWRNYDKQRRAKLFHFGELGTWARKWRESLRV